MEPAKEPVAESEGLTEADLGSIWTYKDNSYEVVELVKVKDPEDGNWYQGVKYKPLDNSVEMPYVRYESDFLSKFKPVPKEVEYGSNGE